MTISSVIGHWCVHLLLSAKRKALLVTSDTRGTCSTSLGKRTTRVQECSRVRQAGHTPYFGRPEKEAERALEFGSLSLRQQSRRYGPQSTSSVSGHGSSLEAATRGWQEVCGTWRSPMADTTGAPCLSGFFRLFPWIMGRHREQQSFLSG